MNLIGAGAFVVWYVVSRGGARRPVELNLKAQDTVTPLMAPQMHAVTESVKTAVHPDLPKVKTKNLNIMFNYNGHAWDAYEVLGVPAGASIKIVTEAYQNSLRSSSSSVDFLETAYKAILNKAS